MARAHSLKVTFSDEELLREPPRTDDVATREEALSILTRLARDARGGGGDRVGAGVA
jgi:hypothetical protein